MTRRAIIGLDKRDYLILERSMYCSNCGKEVSGKFCSNCGYAVSPGPVNIGSDNWPDEHFYDRLINTPEVREKIDRSAALNKGIYVSAETILSVADKAFKPAMGVSFSTIAGISKPIAAALKLEAGKARQRISAEPVGVSIVAALCSLARRGHPLQLVEQADDGCVLLAKIRSDFWTMGGDLAIAIRRQPNGSAIEASTKIKGQSYDWGKSNKVLDKLFEDIVAFRR